MNELHETVTKIETELQNARGELSAFETVFDTDSEEWNLIAELIERLDEASDPEVIEQNIRDTPENYDVDTEYAYVGDIEEGDIVLTFGEPYEVTKVESNFVRTRGPAGGYTEFTFTLNCVNGGDVFTTTHTRGHQLLIELRTP